MNKTKLVLVVAISTAALLAAPTVISLWKDRPRPSLLQLMFWDDTEYSERYSESGFQRVRLGMNRDDVLKNLGRPVRILEECKGRIKRKIDYRGDLETVSFPDLPAQSTCLPVNLVYYYTKPGPSSGHWHVRAVTFSPTEVVTDVMSTFYVD